MKIDKYLYINAHGQAKLYNAGEIVDDILTAKVCVHLDIEIPDEYFEIATFKTRVSLPPKGKGMGTVSATTAVEKWLKSEGPELFLAPEPAGIKAGDVVVKASLPKKVKAELKDEDVPF